MRKLLFLSLLGFGAYKLFWPKSDDNSGNQSGTVPAPAPAQLTIAQQYNRAHVTALDNGFSLIVHDGVLYFDDKPGYFGQYVAQYGQKEMTVPAFEPFAQNFPIQKSLSELFNA